MNQLLSPKKSKYRKQQKNLNRNTSIPKLRFGEFGFYSTDNFWLTSQQIECIRKILLKYTNKLGNIFILVFPDKPITKKPVGTRMGVGKGNVYNWVYQVKKGQILFEFTGIPREFILKTLTQVNYRVPKKLKLYSK